MKQQTLKILKQNGQIDGRSARWMKAPSFTKLYRQGCMGGDIRYRKTRRPFASKKALHVVLKSHHCKAGFGFTAPQVKLKVEELINKLARKTNVTVYKIAVVHNHIHILLHTKRIKSLSSFLRSLAGVLAKRMRKWAIARKLNLKMDQFWSARPYTTLVSFGRQWRTVLNYLEKNRLEASGFVAYTERRHPNQKVLQKIQRKLSIRGAEDPISLTRVPEPNRQPAQL